MEQRKRASGNDKGCIAMKLGKFAKTTSAAAGELKQSMKKSGKKWDLSAQYALYLGMLSLLIATCLSFLTLQSN